MPLVPQANGSDLNAGLRLTTQRALVLTRGTGAAIALADAGAMICRARAGVDSPTVGCQLDVGAGFSGECLRSGKALRCDDSEADPRVDVVSCRRLGIRSILAVPILAGGHVVGLLEVFSSRRFAFNDGDLATVERLAQTVLSTPPALTPTRPPKLLVELEPAYRVFFHNLIGVFSRPAPLKLTSLPGRFWGDVFVPSRVPWERFCQSMVLHVVMVAVFGTFLQLWFPPRHPRYHRLAFDKSDVIYYLPSEYSPPAGRVASPSRMSKREWPAVAKRTVISVPRERHSRMQAEITPPEIKLKHDLRLLRLVSWSSVAPAMPLSATTRRQLSVPAGMVAVIAPPPDISALSRPRTVTAPSTSVIEPPPSVHQSVREIGDISIGHLQVVAPAPQMPMQAQSSIWATMKARLGIGREAVVAPPPSVSGIGNRARQGMGSVSPETRVVPPPPVIQGAGNSPKGSAYGASIAVVPPPPSVNGFESHGRQDMSSQPGGMRVVPPPPVTQGVGNSARGTAYGTGVAVVPPPPSVNGFENQGRQGMSSLPAGVRVVPPPPVVQRAGNSPMVTGYGTAIPVVPPAPSVHGFESSAGQRGHSLPAVAMQVAPPPVAVQSSNESASSVGSMTVGTPPAGVLAPMADIDDDQGPVADTKELSVNFIGPAVALPSSSYFASHEVFIAEERVSRRRTRLIKLVYEFLSYQPRLSDYGPNYPAVDKLRATRDPSCDETGMQVTSSGNMPGQGGRLQLDSKYSNQLESTLPCYRTTADDYRRARTRRH
jgi:GAF domain-containing protein